jgi:hypothetical protein
LSHKINAPQENQYTHSFEAATRVHPAGAQTTAVYKQFNLCEYKTRLKAKQDSSWHTLEKVIEIIDHPPFMYLLRLCLLFLVLLSFRHFAEEPLRN